MKCIYFVLSFLLIFFSVPSSVWAQPIPAEEIRSFHADILVQEDTSIAVEETIQYFTPLSKHGIYRYIPVVYGSGKVQRESHRITDILVTDERGNPIPFSRSRDDAYLNLKIGDADVTFTGEKTYVISYVVDLAIDAYENHTELYWDITGEGWQVPIASATATITSPFASIEQVGCFSGAVGADDGFCESSFSEDTAHFVYPETIAFGDNFTVLVGFPKESGLMFPTEQEQFLTWLSDNWVLFLLPIPTVAVFFVWLKKGRDYQFISQNVFDLDPQQPTQMRPLGLTAREPFVYEPLKTLTPGEAGALIDGRVDTQDVVAEILELARKKHLKIEQVEKKTLIFTSKDYVFTKLFEPVSGLTKVQSYLLTQIFKTEDTVALSKLKGSFYLEMAAAQKLLQESLEQKDVYATKPLTTKAWAMTINMLTSIAVFGAVSLFLLPLGIEWPVFILFLQFGLLALVSAFFAQKSAVGTNLWLQARGLRKTIQYGKWREEIKEKNLFIEEVLPFAVALGVVKKLTKDMEYLNITPPEYLGGSHMGHIAAASFVNDLSSSVAQNLSYNPTSSSRSGGSGFSGGGSSGGGGGGGGGGSW